MKEKMLEFERCPICRSTKIETSDDGKAFKVICKECGNFVEARDTTPFSTEERRKKSARFTWNRAANGIR